MSKPWVPMSQGVDLGRRQSCERARARALALARAPASTTARTRASAAPLVRSGTATGTPLVAPPLLLLLNVGLGAVLQERQQAGGRSLRSRRRRRPPPPPRPLPLELVVVVVVVVVVEDDAPRPLLLRPRAPTLDADKLRGRLRIGPNHRQPRTRPARRVRRARRRPRAARAPRAGCCHRRRGTEEVLVDADVVVVVVRVELDGLGGPEETPGDGQVHQLLGRLGSVPDNGQPWRRRTRGRRAGRRPGAHPADHLSVGEQEVLDVNLQIEAAEGSDEDDGRRRRAFGLQPLARRV
mmetsp:Transcript_101109/g.325650  ORF Transcript_101109/g.325650 Transcript_101109/m.325650 type:complete len:295 (-) Transcript_101109:104-988(-)